MPNFKIIGLLVLENKIFQGFYNIYGHGRHLGHVNCELDYLYKDSLSLSMEAPYPRALIVQAVSEKVFENKNQYMHIAPVPTTPWG